MDEYHVIASRASSAGGSVPTWKSRARSYYSVAMDGVLKILFTETPNFRLDWEERQEPSLVLVAGFYPFLQG